MCSESFLDQQKKIREIEKSLHTAQQMQRHYASRATDLENRLRELKPPFAVGQKVSPVVGRGRGGHATVQAIEKAFGDWVVQVKFNLFDERVYTYMARDLERIETDDEVPF